MMSDAAARAILLSVWPGQTLAAYQIMGAIGRFEGEYGSAFDGANNWGASQTSTVAGECPAGTTPTPDTRADGTPYTACIFQFATPELGAASLVRSLTTQRPAVAAALRTGSPLAVARAMKVPPAYMAAPADRYAVAVARNAQAIARNLKEPLRALPVAGNGFGWLLPAGAAFALWRLYR